MAEYTRFAVFFVPADGSALAEFGASWLGWDNAKAVHIAHPDCPGLDVGAITATPRKYGFHGTLKPPFRLADGQSLDALVDAVGKLASDVNTFDVPPLKLHSLGRFLALVPSAPCRPLSDLAGHIVMQLDPFRAPPGDAELAKRRAAGLSDEQEANLARWGYPYVLDEFRFHLTLTGALQPEVLSAVQARLQELIIGLTEDPLPIRDLALLGESSNDGRLRVIKRFPLAR